MKDKDIRKLNYLLIPIPIVLIILGQTFAKLGSQFISIENFNIIDYLNIFTILAFTCLILRAFVTLILYRKFDLSFLYPITSISYVIVLIISVIVFSESLTNGKIIASILISIGTYLIGSSKFNSKKNNIFDNNNNNNKIDKD